MTTKRKGISRFILYLIVGIVVWIGSTVTIWQLHHHDYHHQQQQQQQQQAKHAVTTRRSLNEEQQQQRQSILSEQMPERFRIPSLLQLTQNPSNGSLNCSSFRYIGPIYDRIVNHRNNNISTVGGIPNILHITYTSRCLPIDLYDAIEKWKNALPQFDIYFHDDDAVNRFLHDTEYVQLWSTKFPNLVHALHCIQYKGAIKIDIWRQLIVYVYGGWYTDIDNWPGHNIDELLRKIENSKQHPTEQPITFVSGSDGSNRPTQWLFAATAKHMISYMTLQQITSNIILEMSSMKYPKVVQITGPEAMKFGYQRYIDNVVLSRYNNNNNNIGRSRNIKKQKRRYRHHDYIMEQLQHDPLTSGDYYDEAAAAAASTNYFMNQRILKLTQEETPRLLGVGSLGGTYNDIVEYVVIGNNNNTSNGVGSSKKLTTTDMIQNMTRRERVALISGFEHWSKELYKTGLYEKKINKKKKKKNDNRQQQHTDSEKGNSIRDISCMEYLYILK